jgi:hypothetical protein
VSAEHPLEEERFLGVRIADIGTERRDGPPYRARISACWSVVSRWTPESSQKPASSFTA